MIQTIQQRPMFMIEASEMHGRLVYRSYLVLIPLALYLVLMYRMLENACQSSSAVFNHKNTLFLPSEGNSRKIMQLKFYNETNNVNDLIREIKMLEKQRHNIEDTLRLFRSKLINNEITLERNSATSKEHDIKLGFRDVGLNFPRHMFNCSNTHMINLQAKIGHGVSKQTFKGTFRGIPVAIKMVTRHQKEVKSCIDAINGSDTKRTEQRAKCFVHPTMKVMKEILLLEQLDHPGFVKLLGYCVRSEESDTSDLSERGVVSVFELGQKLMLGNLQLTTWQERIRHSINLAEFLHYLEHSPLGSLIIRDFKEGHFLMVGTRIKMIDLDDVDNLEPSCNNYLADNRYVKTLKSSCEFGLPCNQGLCFGFNAKHNLKNMNTIFFKRLLYPNMFPKIICEEIGALNADIDSNIISAFDISRRLSGLLEKGLNASG